MFEYNFGFQKYIYNKYIYRLFHSFSTIKELNTFTFYVSGSQFYDMIENTDQRCLLPEETTSISESPRIDESMAFNNSSQEIEPLHIID